MSTPPIVLYSAEPLPRTPRFEPFTIVHEPPRAAYYLEYLPQEDMIALRKHASPEHPLVVDFVGAANEWKRQKLSAKTDLLAKACGARAGRSVCDLTLGLGADAFKLAYFGADVTGVERDPLVHGIVRDAVERLRAHGARYSLRVRFGDGRLFAREYYAEYDCFYVDPMFDLGKRSALPKKKMQFLNDILGENKDEDFAEIVDFLRAREKRVVVKRHPDAPSFAGLTPRHVFAGKKIRFEVY